jgi:hypothetical protein
LTPRKAAKREETGGRPAMWWATPASTPWLRSPSPSELDSEPESPPIISEKKMPIESAVPVFWKVERMPEAAPRCEAGTLPMIEEEFGELNMPTPIPLAKISAPKAQ